MAYLNIASIVPARMGNGIYSFLRLAFQGRFMMVHPIDLKEMMLLLQWDSAVPADGIPFPNRFLLALYGGFLPPLRTFSTPHMTRTSQNCVWHSSRWRKLMRIWWATTAFWWRSVESAGWFHAATGILDNASQSISICLSTIISTQLYYTNSTRPTACS